MNSGDTPAPLHSQQVEGSTPLSPTHPLVLGPMLLALISPNLSHLEASTAKQSVFWYFDSLCTRMFWGS